MTSNAVAADPITADFILELHQEANHLCVRHASTLPDLSVACNSCGARLQAEALSPCIGWPHETRLILMLRCPKCQATGQLRFGRMGPVNELEGRLPDQAETIEVTEGGCGYVNATCSCGGCGVIQITEFAPDNEVVHLVGALPGCTHPLVITLPRGRSFRLVPHSHGGR